MVWAPQLRSTAEEANRLVPHPADRIERHRVVRPLLRDSLGAISPVRRRYPVVVTKRLIEVDDDKLETVRGLLGTRTLKATVDEAFNEVLALDQRLVGAARRSRTCFPPTSATPTPAAPCGAEARPPRRHVRRHPSRPRRGRRATRAAAGSGPRRELHANRRKAGFASRSPSGALGHATGPDGMAIRRHGPARARPSSRGARRTRRRKSTASGEDRRPAHRGGCRNQLASSCCTTTTTSTSSHQSPSSPSSGSLRRERSRDRTPAYGGPDVRTRDHTSLRRSRCVWLGTAEVGRGACRLVRGVARREQVAHDHGWPTDLVAMGSECRRRRQRADSRIAGNRHERRSCRDDRGEGGEPAAGHRLVTENSAQGSAGPRQAGRGNRITPAQRDSEGTSQTHANALGAGFDSRPPPQVSGDVPRHPPGPLEGRAPP